MFWSYAGNVGDVHHMGVATVSSAVALASLVGGLWGSITAILVVKRLPRMFIIVVAAIGGAATTYAAIYVFNPVAFSIILLGFQFFWNLLYPIQMGLFSWADTSGRLAMLAWFVQLIACAIGPAVGGFVCTSAHTAYWHWSVRLDTSCLSVRPWCWCPSRSKM